MFVQPGSQNDKNLLNFGLVPTASESRLVVIHVLCLGKLQMIKDTFGPWGQCIYMYIDIVPVLMNKRRSHSK